MCCLRRDYIELLNANTLSLDGLAELNSALREIVHTDTWNKQKHVQWLVNIAFDILDSIEQDDDHTKLLQKLME